MRNLAKKIVGLVYKTIPFLPTLYLEIITILFLQSHHSLHLHGSTIDVAGIHICKFFGMAEISSNDKLKTSDLPDGAYIAL